jgi:alanyl-tRNA synthetase
VTRTAAQVRQEFLDFFRQRGHTIVPSSPVVPLDDPTLLFTNAGMNQFKPYFLGLETPRFPRAADTQKCIRAGGKHNDLDDVGHDTYHHTFFEMLGNWSFGDYFKKEAIAWAWELLVEVWGIDPTRLHATYFRGDPAEGLEPDLEARDLWLQILPAERVHAGSKKDNFWEMGETGPCGPCSEIHIDLTPDKSGAPLVNVGDARVIEIWNLVFIQFNRAADGKLTPLPAKHVDTGMGFERVTAILQGHNNNYATDVFVPILQAIEKISGHRYGEGEAPAEPHVASAPRGRRVAADPRVGRDSGGVGVPPANRYARFTPGDMRDESCRVIADHIRCLVFALTDGAVPDREGRGYVLRRILRRAVRYGWQYLNLHEPFLYKLVPTVVEGMGEAFPELRKNPGHVQDLLREEEESFGQTLERGIALFEEAADFAVKRHHGEIQGEDAFKLHDTYGFPIDLTEVMARERGLRVDYAEYERLMDEARERARAGATAVEDAVFDEWHPQAVPVCDDSPKYDPGLECVGTIRMLQRFATTGARRPVCVVTDRTCFYAEQGGQVSDTGWIVTSTGRVQVVRLRRFGDTVIHCGYITDGDIDVRQSCTIRIDLQRRATMKNHTATHVMNWALREVLGEHVQQKGSLVDHEKTRFDFSHPKPLTPEEIERVEQLVNERVRAKLPVYYKIVPQQDALKISGLRAVFGERYPDMVRVMSVGVPVEELIKHPDNPEWRKYSVEFCGGTHLSNTADIEHFTITTEEAVAKGIRRIVAVTGETARKIEQTGAALVQRAEQLKRGPADAVSTGLTELQNVLATATIPLRDRHRLRELMTELQAIVKQQQKSEAADAAEVVKRAVAALLQRAGKAGNTTVVVGEMPDVPLEQLKMGADQIKQKCGSAAVLFGVRVAPVAAGGSPADDRSEAGPTDVASAPRGRREPADDRRRPQGGDATGKAVLLAAMTPDLVKKGLKAGDLVKAIAPIIAGGGGGPPTMAQAGGKQPENLAKALEAGRNWIVARLEPRAGE